MAMPKRKRVLILTTKLGYQTRAFVDAAHKLELDVSFGTDRCGKLEDPWGDQAVPLKFENPDEAARRVLAAENLGKIDAVVSLGDRPTPTAARIAHALQLPHHSAAAADVCRDKYRSREILRSAGLDVPKFVRVPLDAGEESMLRAIEAQTNFPCVLKPLALSGSRGVIRVNNEDEAVAAFDRIRKLLTSSDVQVLHEDTSNYIQIEEYVDGIEVAVEAVMDRGKLRVLAIFDKPDPLQGPFFEETLYVTPSRLPEKMQLQIVDTLARSCEAIGLSHGPIHAEMRVNGARVWPLEIAARSIGGLCSRALRFPDGEFGLQSLEEVILRLALGEPMENVTRESCASGVMMIPIPEPGIYRGVSGENEAIRVKYVDEVRITAKQEQKLVPLPEGASYLGFIFARAEQPEQVEIALRQAHSKLRFEIATALRVV